MGEVIHLDKPLHRQARLDSDLGALAHTHIVGIVLNALHQSGGLEVLGDSLATVEAVHAHIHTGTLGDCGIVIEDVNNLEVVSLAEHIIVLVMSRSDLEATGTELDVDITVLDNGNYAIYQGHDYLATAEPAILGVLGIDTHGGIAHDCLGTSGGDHGIVATLVVDVHHLALGRSTGRGLAVGKIIAQVIELGLLLLKEHLVVADSSEVLGVPIDHAQSAVNQALVIEVAEHLGDAEIALIVHGECGAVPVA